MSPARSVTGTSSMARRMETADGPPAPVTSTRGVSAGIDRLPRKLEGVLLLDGGGHDRLVAVTHDLEWLDVAGGGEARPVAGRGAQQLLVEVVADLDLRCVCLNDFDLALQELIDHHEPRRLELDRGRRRLITEDSRDAAGGDQRGAMRVAVVLMDVADRVRVDRARTDVLDDLEDRADRRAALAHAGVGQ